MMLSKLRAKQVRVDERYEGASHQPLLAQLLAGDFSKGGCCLRKRFVIFHSRPKRPANDDLLPVGLDFFQFDAGVTLKLADGAR